MNINQIQYALTVARYKNFSKAAESLFLSQPALSLQIKKLEQELGFSLFTRKAQGVSITKEGEAFFRDALAVETAWNQMLRNASAVCGQTKRHLNIAVSTRVYSNGLFDSIISFFENHPELEVSFFTEAGADSFSALRDGTLDIALDRLPPEPLISDSEIFYSCELIEEQQCILMAQKNQRYKDMETITYEDLQNSTFITGLEHSMEDRSLRQICKEHKITLGKVYRSDGIDTVMNLVRNHKGITLGPQSFAEYFHVRAVPLEPSTYISLNFICLKTRAAAPEIMLLKNHLIRACNHLNEL